MCYTKKNRLFDVRKLKPSTRLTLLLLQTQTKVQDNSSTKFLKNTADIERHRPDVSFRGSAVVQKSRFINDHSAFVAKTVQ